MSDLYDSPTVILVGSNQITGEKVALSLPLSPKEIISQTVICEGTSL
jgi:hypothetical protein